MLNIFVALAIRCLLVGLFLPFSALDKILNFNQAVAQATQAIPSRLAAMALIVCGFCIEIVMSAAILTGVCDRAGAFILAGYCIVTAILWKQFWNAPDFRLKGASRGRDIFWDFLKNLALAGGFLLLAFGDDAAGVSRFLSDPFGSSHPYNIVEHANP